MPRPLGYLTIQNFRFGLDARRSELTSTPGTLLRAVDCHVNQGAELEKRKAFVKTSLPSGVFGFLPVSTGIYVFGTKTPATIGELPAPFLYQQLADFDTGTYTVYPFVHYENSKTIPLILSNGGNIAYCVQYNQNATIPLVVGATIIITGIIIPGFTQFNGVQTVTNVTSLGGTGGKTWWQITTNLPYTGASYTKHLNFPPGSVSMPGNMLAPSVSGNALTGILSATIINGNPFVVAQFGTDIGVFNNGQPVTDFVAGEVFANATSIGDLATQLGYFANLTPNFLATIVTT